MHLSVAMPELSARERSECIMTHLLRMAVVDGHRSAQEKELIGQYQQQFGLSREQIEACVSAALADRELPLPDCPRAREEIFGEIVKLASCDGLEAQEIVYLQGLAGEFGIEAKRVDALIQRGQDGT